MANYLDEVEWTPDRHERFLAKIERTTECWNWTGGLHGDPDRKYGKFCVESAGRTRTLTVHRLAHELFIGPIPDGHQVDHLCFNRVCVNPAHLEAVAPIVNQRRRRRIGPTKFQDDVCKNGHEWNAENSYWPPGRSSKTCRVCSRASRARHFERKRGQAAAL